MSTWSWNCRGLGTPWALQFLKESILQKSPDFIFLSEILCKVKRVEKVKDVIGFEGAFTVETHGHSGGLALLWRNKKDVSVMSYNRNHTYVVIETKGWDKYRLTGFYGEPDRAKRKDTWNLIRQLHSQMNLPWVLIGDMNNIVHQEDKRGGRPYPLWLVNGFQKCLEDCGLHDLELDGYPYTWGTGYGTSNWMEIRLDRALVSNSFMQQFREAKLTNLKITTSDHSPILLEPFTRHTEIRVKRLRFENAWLRDPMCGKIVEETWQLNKVNLLQRKLVLLWRFWRNGEKKSRAVSRIVFIS
ncbi:uncharacterized protein LOC141680200 [Apium graveolens]|uniref:uncharacterized protein LOC141680200 n=1 Tax=Apium graveolens TaxID=4045 RepID=UPI003D7B713C